MQLSVLPVSFYGDIIAGRMSVAEWARMGAELGLDAVDLSILFVPDRKLTSAEALRRDVESAGMTVTMVSTYPDFTHPDAAQRERELAMEQEAVRLCAAMGARYVRITAGQAHPETGCEEGIAWAAEGMRKLVETVGDVGPQLLWENHGKPGVWQYTDFCQPADIFLRIAEATEGIGLGINYDTANAVAFTEDPVGLLKAILPRVVTIHAADTPVKGALAPVIIGQGIAPFNEVFTILHQGGWDGWICIEEASNEGLRGVEEGAAFVRRMWAETA